MAITASGDLREEEQARDVTSTAAREQEHSLSKKKKKKKKKPQQSKEFAHVEIYPAIKGLDTVKVAEDAVSGRCVIASRVLQAGELVLHEPAFAKVLRRDCATRQCANCCRQVPEGGEIEADVPFAVYCSRACKAQEAAIRAAEAGALGKLTGISAARDVDVDLLRMVLRLLITRAKALGLCRPDGNSGSQGDDEDKGGATAEGSFLLQQWDNLYALMHHREAMAPEWISVVREAAGDLLDAIPEWARVDVEEVVQLACRVNVNAHGLRDDSGSNLVIGLGLFPLIAMINHACRPNCTFVFFGGKLEVRTLEQVASGTELTVHYIDLLQSTAARRQELLVLKHFLCKCSRCESPPAVDGYLDGVCCVDCGEIGCLTSTPPPNPEEIIAAQLAQLGGSLAEESAGSKSGKSRGKSSTTKPKDGGGGSNAARGRTSSTASTIAGDSRGNGVRNGVGGGGRTGMAGTDACMYCSACGRQYPTRAIEESVARAKASWDSAMAVLRTTHSPLARKSLDKWLEDYDAGSAPPRNVTKKQSLKKDLKKDRVKLHPANALVIQTLVSLSNCCNFEADPAASARHLRRAVLAMEAVYPPNYPELGDFYAALADANNSLLETRGDTLPKKLRSQAVSERKQALERAATIRVVCLGKDHPTTKGALRALDRAS